MSGQPRRRRPRRAPRPAAGTPPENTGASPPVHPLEPEEPDTPAPSKARRRRRRRKTNATANTKDKTKAAAARTSAAAKEKPPTKAQLAARATSTRKEVSAGGVVYRRTEDGELEILLAARRTLKGNIAWGLAKGHIEEGESPEDAAVREVREETGWEAVIEESLGLTKYFYVWENVRIRKTVHFFLMRATQGDPADRDDEMEEIRWFPLDRSLKRAAYRGERDVLLRAADILG